MANLNTRQIVILIVTIIVVLYGAYTMLLSGKKPNDIKEFNHSWNDVNLNSVAADLMKKSLDIDEAYVVSRAETDWEKNPFWEKSSFREWAAGTNVKTKDDPATKIVYSGYVDAGKKKMAVINGAEYSLGEKLDTNDYVVKKITPQKVVLSNKNNKNELEVIIQD